MRTGIGAAGRCIAPGYVRGEALAAVQVGTRVEVDLWRAGRLRYDRFVATAAPIDRRP